MSATRFNTAPSSHRVTLTNEKVTGPAAAELLRQSKIVEAHEVEILDNATGAGVLVDKLLDLTTTHPGFQVKRIVAGDIDDSMLVFAAIKQQEVSRSSAWKDVNIAKIDQMAIPCDDNSFTHVFSNFGIFFCQHDSKALSEAYRVLKPGGIVGFTSWKACAGPVSSRCAKAAIARWHVPIIRLE
jgi:ubiquinone/menaquinone biosynthesis C-methylase UbiE